MKFTEIISFRTSKKEKKAIKKLAADLKMSVSAYLRDIMLSMVYKIPTPATKLSQLRPPPIVVKSKQKEEKSKQFVARGDLLVELKQVLNTRGIIN